MGSPPLEEILDVTVFLNLSEAYEFWFQALLIFVAVGIYAYTRKALGRWAEWSGATGAGLAGQFDVESTCRRGFLKRGRQDQ